MKRPSYLDHEVTFKVFGEITMDDKINNYIILEKISVLGLPCSSFSKVRIKLREYRKAKKLVEETNDLLLISYS